LRRREAEPQLVSAAKLAFPAPDLLADVRASALEIRVPAARERDRRGRLDPERTLPERLGPALVPRQELGENHIDRHFLGKVPKRDRGRGAARGPANRAELIGRTVTDETRDLDRPPRPDVQRK
jgi:hypothetical protein